MEREGRLQGGRNSPLTRAGRDQARRQARLLDCLDLSGMDIRTSPQGRAVQTAGIALAARAAWIRTDERLREIGVGDWTGRRRAEIGTGSDNDPSAGTIALYDRAPGGEGFAALRARCAGLLHDLAGPAVLVTHGITSRMIRAIALGLPDAALGDLPGGQGIVHHVAGGAARVLD